MRMAPALARNLAPGGRAVLSGLLGTQAPEVLDAHRRLGLTLDFQLRLGEWSVLVLRKPKASGEPDRSAPWLRARGPLLSPPSFPRKRHGKYKIQPGSLCPPSPLRGSDGVGGDPRPRITKNVRCIRRNFESMATPTPALSRQSAGLTARRGRGKKEAVAINEKGTSPSAFAGMTEG